MTLQDLTRAELPSSLPEAATLVEDLYLRLSAWLEGHLPEIGTLLAASVLYIYGRVLSEHFRHLIENWPFIVRVALFVGLVGFGFGLIISTISPVITAGLQWAGTPFLFPAVLAAFLVIGILAERSGRI